jgi:polar amino acid transport system substrate-binding protein
MKTPFRMLAFGAALVLTACGGESGSPPASSASGPSLQAAIASEVPADIKAKKAIQVGVDATYAPNESIDPNTGRIIGWDIDLGNAIGAVIGVPFVWNNADFNSIIPDIGTRYDVGISSFTPNATREKTVDFVTYYQAGESWLVKSGGPQINSPTDMCGQTIAVETGTTEEADAYGFMGKNPDGSTIKGDANHCKDAGKQDITVHSFTKQTDANADLLSGHSTIGWLDQPVSDYQVKLSNGQLQISGKPCSVSPYGIALPKNSGLEKAFEDAIKYLIDNGFYTTILNRWAVADGAITSSAVALNNNNSVGASCVPSY